MRLRSNFWTLSLFSFGLLAIAGCQDSASGRGNVSQANAAQRTGNPGDAKRFDWPQWLGPQSNGTSLETGWNDRWSSDGPKKLWSAQIGTGFASIAVADGRAFAMGYKDGNDTVYCFNAADGQLNWKHSYPCKLVDNLHEGGPAATPTVDGNLVYTVSKEGQVFALDVKSGQVEWAIALQPLLDVGMPDWGFSGSVLIVGDKLIVEAGRTCALEKKTGKLLWKTEKYRAGYGSPTLFQPDQAKAASEALIAVLNNDVLLVMRLDNGQELAKLPWETSYATSACTPLAKGNTLFISTGYKKGCLLAEYKDGQLNKLYENKKIRNHMANCIPVDGALYGIDGQSNEQSRCKLVCMDAATGKVHWEEPGFGCGTVMAADGKLLILSDEGELVSAKAAIEGYQQISRGRVLEGKCWTMPVLAQGRIYCRNAAGDLVCLDVR